MLTPFPLSTPPLPQPAPTTEREVFLNIFDYIDRLFNMVRPRKLVYMAIGERPFGGGRANSCGVHAVCSVA